MHGSGATLMNHGSAGAQTILLVEDEVIIRMSLRKQLIAVGISVILEAGTGEEAVTIAKARNPDVVCMDIRLKGGLDGIEAAKRIGLFSSAPIIFMTAYEYREVARKAAGVNIAAVLDKPVSIDELAAAIKVARGRT